MTRNSVGRAAVPSSLLASFLLTCGAVGCSDSSSAPPPPADELDAYVEVPSANLGQLIADPGRPYVYVSDRAAASIRFFNTDTRQFDRTLSVGSKPGPMDLSRDGRLLFVALQGAASVAVVDLATPAVLSPITVSGTAEAVAVGANDQLYVSVHGEVLDVFDVSSLPATPAGTVSKGSSELVLGGRSGDRRRIFTHDASTSLQLTAWDVSRPATTEAVAADVCSGPPVVSPSSDGATFAALQNASYFDPRWPMEDGDVPIFRTVDLQRAATVNVEWNASAVAMCPGTGRIVVAHTDRVLNPSTPPVLRHLQGTGDLHTFDGTTYAETTRYALRTRVRPYGIACAPDGSIYLILGTDVGTALGVIAAP